MLQTSDELTVKFSSVPILSFSLRSLIKNRLRQVISSIGGSIQARRSNLVAKPDPIQPFRALEVIPLNRVKDVARIAYQSAIALKFANQWGLSATELAEQIVIDCSLSDFAKEDNYLPLERIYQHFVFQVKPSGWIYIELADPGIALWLQMLTTYDSGLNWAKLPFDQNIRHDQNIRQTSVCWKSDSNFFQNAISLFEIQYTHARCCTLLRLGVQAGLIADLPLLLHPNPFPWLTIDRSLMLQHPAERRLIQQISTVLDHLSELPVAGCPSLIDEESIPPSYACLGFQRNAVKNPNNRQQEILKLAQTLSQQVQVCDATCRIWEDVRRNHLALAQARLGLTLVTQIVLHMLLEKELGVTAPVEL